MPVNYMYVGICFIDKTVYTLSKGALLDPFYPMWVYTVSRNNIEFTQNLQMGIIDMKARAKLINMMSNRELILLVCIQLWITVTYKTVTMPDVYVDAFFKYNMT